MPPLCKVDVNDVGNLPEDELDQCYKEDSGSSDLHAELNKSAVEESYKNTRTAMKSYVITK